MLLTILAMFTFFPILQAEVQGKIPPEIMFNKEEYTPFDKVIVSITSPYNNQNSDSIDTIDLLISSSSDSLGIQKFPETAPNTGMFEREFTLTPNKELFPGDLKTVRGDAITVGFRFDEDTFVTETVFINYHLAIVEFDRDSFRISERGFLRVIDPDANRNPGAMDTTGLRFWSTTDRGGMWVVLRERGNNSGIFEEIIRPYSDFEIGHGLRINEGDIMTAKYTDNTLPSPAVLDAQGVFTVEVKELFANAVIGPGVPPLNRAVASEAELVDHIGAPVTDVSIASQVLIQSEITNSQTKKQSFAYVVQIKDEREVTVSLSWITGELPATESLRAAQSWIPDTQGDFAVEIFVWESLEKPVALSPVRTSTISVN